jgi:hypothetical protein
MNKKDLLTTSDSHTLEHINEVRKNIWKLIRELDTRGQIHDASKFHSPEREIFAANFEKLAKTVYGSPEYQKLKEEVQVAIDHHYAGNRHHAEHWPNGMEDMDLLDVIEMLADWTAATKRNKNGNIHKSIDFNTPKYKIPPMLAMIMRNTVNRYF